MPGGQSPVPRERPARGCDSTTAVVSAVAGSSRGEVGEVVREDGRTDGRRRLCRSSRAPGTGTGGRAPPAAAPRREREAPGWPRAALPPLATPDDATPSPEGTRATRRERLRTAAANGCRDVILPRACGSTRGSARTPRSITASRS